jgi:hypothetical protein
VFRVGDVPARWPFTAFVLAVTSAPSARLWWHMSSPARGLEDVDRDDHHRTMLRSVPVSMLYLLAVPLVCAVPAGGSPSRRWSGSFSSRSTH